jgi:hypothetical protein
VGSAAQLTLADGASATCEVELEPGGEAGVLSHPSGFFTRFDEPQRGTLRLDSLELRVIVIPRRAGSARFHRL